MATFRSFTEFDNEWFNHSLLCRAIIDVGGQVLRDVLAREIPPKDIYQKLKMKNFKMTPANRKILMSASTLHSYQEFDITLLYSIIRSLCPLLVPTAGWGSAKVTSTSETNVGDDIERINIMRNQIVAHPSSTRVSDSDFKKYWHVLRDVMVRMDRWFDGQSNYNEMLNSIESYRYMAEAHEREKIESEKEKQGVHGKYQN